VRLVLIASATGLSQCYISLRAGAPRRLLPGGDESGALQELLRGLRWRAGFL